MQMTAPLLLICLIYIIHDAPACRTQRESAPTAEIRAENRDECKHQEQGCTFSCTLTRLIRGSWGAAQHWGLTLRTCQSNAATQASPASLIAPCICPTPPPPPCLLSTPAPLFVLDTRSHLAASDGILIWSWFGRSFFPFPPPGGSLKATRWCQHSALPAAPACCQPDAQPRNFLGGASAPPPPLTASFDPRTLAVDRTRWGDVDQSGAGVVWT